MLKQLEHKYENLQQFSNKGITTKHYCNGTSIDIDSPYLPLKFHTRITETLDNIDEHQSQRKDNAEHILVHPNKSSRAKAPIANNYKLHSQLHNHFFLNLNSMIKI